VLHRQASYDGPADLARAIRKADPTYDATKDPDLRKDAPGLSVDELRKLAARLPKEVYVLGLAAAAFVLWKRAAQSSK
jgi:hypothetical protein